MTDPVSFLSSTPRLALPMLYSGQAQKEVTVNEALTIADLLLHGSIEGEMATPPTAPSAGQLWLVASSPLGGWSGHAGSLAGWSEGGWRFVAPRPGMRLLDRSTGAFRLYDDQWRSFARPMLPTGGTVIDVEARAAIAEMLAIISAAGVFA